MRRTPFLVVAVMAILGCGGPPSKSGIVGSWRGDGKYKAVTYEFSADHRYYKSFPAFDANSPGYVVSESGTWKIVTGPDPTPVSIELKPQTYAITDPLGKKEDRSDAEIGGFPIIGTPRPYTLIWSGPDKFRTSESTDDAFLFRVKN